MAARPWVTPEEVRAYSDRADVQGRDNTKLAVDISRAEARIVRMTGNDFADDEDYPALPEPVKTAALILAEAIANNSVQATKTLKSETFDDYSYTAEDATVDLDGLGLDDLLAPYIVDSDGRINMRLRRL